MNRQAASGKEIRIRFEVRHELKEGQIIPQIVIPTQSKWRHAITNLRTGYLESHGREQQSPENRKFECRADFPLNATEKCVLVAKNSRFLKKLPRSRLRDVPVLALVLSCNSLHDASPLFAVVTDRMNNADEIHFTK